MKNPIEIGIYRLFIKMGLSVLSALTLTSCAVRQTTDDDEQRASPQREPAEATALDPCAAKISWTKGPALPIAVDHHATFASDASGQPFLYVIGGFDGSAVHNEVWRAPIQDDGTLADFEPTGSLPAGRSGAGLAVIGRDVWLAGGFVGGGFSNSVIHGSIDDDGHLGAWTEASELPGIRFHGTLEVASGFLFFLGGVNDRGDAQDTVFRGTLGDDGAVSWESMPAMPLARSHHGSFVHENVLFAVGGLRGNPFQNATTANADGIRASIREDGTLEPWTTIPGFALDVSTHAVSTGGDCTFVLGGAGGELFEPSAKVYRFTPDTEELILDEVADPLPAALSHRHQVPLFRGHFYAAAGSLHHVASSDVFIGALVND